MHLENENKKESEDAPEETIDFSCPNCGISLRVDLKHKGKRSMCPHCRKRVQIPKAGKKK